MKKLFYFLFLLALCSRPALGSSPDTIPNQGFERWLFTSWFSIPDQWNTSNSQLLAPTVLMDSVAHTGTLAMKLTYQGNITPVAWCGFPLSTHPQNLGGFMKNWLNTGDSATISVYLYDNQLLADSGYGVYYGGINPNYHSFIVPIGQQSSQADSCVIFITGGHGFGSDISFDDLQFDFPVGIPEKSDGFFRFFPNPCSDFLFIESENQIDFPAYVRVFDPAGRQADFLIYFDYLESSPNRNHKACLNTSLLKPGVWLLEFKNDHCTRRFIIIKV
jgi:hypothetical protein